MKAQILSFCADKLKHKQLLSSSDSVIKRLGAINIDSSRLSLYSDASLFADEIIKNTNSAADITIILNGTGADSSVKDLLCKALSKKCVKNDTAIKWMQYYCNAHNIEFKNEWVGSVLLPQDAVVFNDPDSVFSGFAILTNQKTYIVLPDNGGSTNNILNEEVLPFLAKQKGTYISYAVVKAFGIAKEKADTVFSAISNDKITVEVTENYGETAFSITAEATTQDSADSLCSMAIDCLRDTLGDSIYCIGEKSIAEITVNTLKQQGLLVSSAESCTGGMFSQAITGISGASDIFELGICCYSNGIKQKLLNVPAETIENHGAVSSQTAICLAQGIKAQSGSDIAIGITGVAGPSTSEGKSVGTVYISLCSDTHTFVKNLDADSSLDRDTIRRLAVNTAADMIRRYVLIGESSFSECDISKNETQSVTDYNFTKALNTNEGFCVAADSDFDLFDQFDYDLPEEKSTISPINFKGLNLKLPKIKFSLKGKPLSLVIVAVFAAVIVIAGIMIGYFVSGSSQKALIENAQKIMQTKPYTEAFTLLDSENSDFTAWLTLDGSKINNPVYQTDNNTYYINHNMDKEKSRYGALFFDKNSTVTGEMKSNNLVIYGQNINDGSMFGSLQNLTDSTYLKQHNTLQLQTEEGATRYQIFAVFIINARKAGDNGYLFNFMRSYFSGEADFNSWLGELNQRNIYTTDNSPTMHDQLLTLVTTSDAFDGARLVVMAKAIDLDSVSDISIGINPAPRYPQAWYDKRGTVNPFIQ